MSDENVDVTFAELVTVVAEVTQMSKKDVGANLKKFAALVGGISLSAQELVIGGFGTFSQRINKPGIVMGKETIGSRSVAFKAHKKWDTAPIVFTLDTACAMVAGDEELTGESFQKVVEAAIETVRAAAVQHKRVKFPSAFNISGKFVAGGERNVAGRLCQVADKTRLVFAPSGCIKHKGLE